MTITPAKPSPSQGFQHLDTNDASQHAQAQQWLQVEYSQIDAGEFDGYITSQRHGPVTCFLEYQNKAVHKRAEVPVNHCTVSMIDHGHGAARFMRHSMEQSDLLFLMPGETDCDLVIPGGVATSYAVMDEQKLQGSIRALSEKNGEQEVSSLQVYQSQSSRMLLEQLMSIAVNRKELPAQTAEECEEVGQILLHQLALIVHQASAADGLASSDGQLRQRRLEVVRKTRDYILSSLDSHYSPSVVDICHHVGVCARVLQYSFQEYLQITPVAYLRILRLNKVRQQFIVPVHANVTVTEVATRFGFLHLSKFAQDYASLFGERPSQTLQRALR